MRTSEFSRFYQDLLGRKFVDGGRDPATGLDCLGVVRAYLSRVRAQLPPDAFPLDQTETTAGEALGWLEGCAARWWDRLGDSPLDARLLGDVVFTLAGRDIKRPHVSVLVYPVHPKLLLSATIHRGTYTIPLDRALVGRELIGVYRLRYEPREPLGRKAA